MWEERLELYDRLIDMNPKFDRKGKTMPYTSANGYMFSQLNKDGEIGIRLPKEVGKKFMDEYQTTGFKSYGAFLRDYVLVPESLLEDLELLSSYLDQSYEYVMSLEPKKGKK